MLRLHDITFTYLGSHEPSICNITHEFELLRIWLISGDNGSGKTTLALTACGVIPNLIKGDFCGEVRWKGVALDERNISSQSTVVFQNAYMYFQSMTVREELSLCPSVDPTRDRCSSALLPSVAPDTPLHMLSHGQQARVALCSAMRQQTPILILDEPFEFLDEEGTYLLGTALENELERGRLIIIVDRHTSLNLSRLPYSKLRVSAGKLCNDTLGTGEVRPVLNDSPSHTSALSISNLSFQYRHQLRRTIDAAEFCVHQGECVAIIGPNGCGKSTLLLLMAGLLERQTGSVYLRNKKVAPARLRKYVRCVMQNPEAQIFGVTIQDEFEFELRAAGYNQSAIAQKIDAVSKQFSIDMQRDPFTLSYGQKKLICLVAAIITEPQVLLLDEPTAGLDASSVRKLCELLEVFLRHSGAIVISGHSTAEVDGLCSRIMKMQNGRFSSEHNHPSALTS